MDIEETITKLKELVEIYRTKKEETKLAWADVASLAAKVKHYYQEIETSEYLNLAEKTKVKLVPSVYYKIPKDSGRREQVMQWLKQQGYYDDYATVNAKSFNKLIESEFSSDTVVPEFIEVNEYIDIKIGNLCLTKGEDRE